MERDGSTHAGIVLPSVGRVRGQALIHLVFLVPVVVFLVLLAALRPAELSDARVLLGLGLVAVTTVATFAVPWSRLPADARMVLPVLDLAALGSIRLLPGAPAVATLAVLPAIWMGVVYLRRGVVVVTAASVITLALPALHFYGTSLEGWSRAILHPTVVLMVAFSTWLMARSWVEQRTRLERQSKELKTALTKADRNSQLTDAIMTTVDVGLLAIGPDGSYDWMNPQQREFLQIVFPQGHEGQAGQLGDVFAADNVTALTYAEMPSIRAKNGEAFSGYLIWVGQEPAQRRAHSASARPIFNERGELDGAVLAYQDVTDLMRALRVKDEFVASVSHELRTPLTSIIGYLDLAAEHGGDLGEQVTHFLGVASRNAGRLLQLVTDLLTTAQFEEGAMRLSPVLIDLGEVVRAALLDVEQRAIEGGVVLHSDVAQLSPLLADPDRLGQVVENLLSNAVKYTLPGGTVHVTLRRDDDHVCLSVRDTGIGISAAEQPNLFTKFFRAAAAEERAIPGAGLGLVITKAIVEAHGGVIDVVSAEGEGTTVTVRLAIRTDAVAGTSETGPASGTQTVS